MAVSESPEPIATFKASSMPPRWDVSGPPYQFTREELIDVLKSVGYEMSERQLRSWATAGLIPHPERRLPPGATDGVARAIYPKEVFNRLLWLLPLAADGVKIAELKEIVSKDNYSLLRADDENDQALSVVHVSGMPHLSSSGRRTVRPLLWKRGMRALDRAINNYAEQYEKRRGVALTHATVIFRAANGEEVVIDFGPPKTQNE